MQPDMPDRIWIRTKCFAKPLPLHWLIQPTPRDPHWAGLSQRFRSRAPVVLLSLDRVRSVPRVPTDPLPWRSPSRTPSNRKNRNVFPVRATRLGTDPPPFYRRSAFFPLSMGAPARPLTNEFLAMGACSEIVDGVVKRQAPALSRGVFQRVRTLSPPTSVRHSNIMRDPWRTKPKPTSQTVRRSSSTGKRNRSGSASRHGVGTGFAGIVGRQTMERGSAGNITDLLLRREPPRFARSTRD